MSATVAEIYLDAAATTPPLTSVIEAMQVVERRAWGNPSSLHKAGLAAAESLERSRQSLARQLSADRDDLIFTSGATESVHLALLGSAAGLPPARLVISAVEHPAVVAAAERLRACGWQVQTWPVDPSGLIRLDCLDALLSPPTRLVSLIWGQGEIGALQPLITVGLACRRQGIRCHTDATQLMAQGRIRWRELPIDLLTCSAHKFQGPRGVGLLLKRAGLALTSLQGGGGQEQGLRGGTEPVALVAGFAEALSHLPEFDALNQAVPPGASPRIRHQRDQLLQSLQSLRGVQLSGPGGGQRLPNHVSLLLTTPNGRPLSGRAVVRELSRLGVAVSSGSACSAGLKTDSPVLSAMNLAPELRQSGLRITLGPWITDQQLDGVSGKLAKAMATVAAD